MGGHFDVAPVLFARGDGPGALNPEKDAHAIPGGGHSTDSGALQLEITWVPKSVMNNLVAGARYQPAT